MNRSLIFGWISYGGQRLQRSIGEAQKRVWQARKGDMGVYGALAACTKPFPGLDGDLRKYHVFHRYLARIFLEIPKSNFHHFWAFQQAHKHPRQVQGCIMDMYSARPGPGLAWPGLSWPGLASWLTLSPAQGCVCVCGGPPPSNQFNQFNQLN